MLKTTMETSAYIHTYIHMQTLVMFQHAENMGEWTGMASGETIRNVRQCPSSACPKDLLYLRQGSSQCHKDLHIAGHPDFLKSTTQSQQHKKMPLVSAARKFSMAQ